MKTQLRLAIIFLMILYILSEKCSILDCTLDVVDTDPCFKIYQENNEYNSKLTLRQCKPGYYCLNALMGEYKESYCTKIPEQFKNAALLEDFYYNPEKYSLEEAMTFSVISYSYPYIKYGFFFWSEAYPGENCLKNSNCLSESCINSKCTGISEGNKCDKTRECDVGLYCKEQICSKLQKEGEACEKDTDCDYTCGCLLKKCTKYYSLPDGTKLSIYKDKRLCKSGFLKIIELTGGCNVPPDVAPNIYMELSNCQGVFQCDSITLTSEQCTNDQNKCTYSYGSDNSLLEEVCRCDGIIADGSKFCSSKSVVKEFYGFNVIDDTENMLILPNENRHTLHRFESTYEDDMKKKFENKKFNCMRRSFMGELIDIHEKKTDGVDIVDSNSTISDILLDSNNLTNSLFKILIARIEFTIALLLLLS